MTEPTGGDDRLRLVLFDWDGTLADSMATICAAMGAAFRERGRPTPERADVCGAVGLRLETIIARLAPDADAAEQAALVTEYRRCFAREVGRPDFSERLFPGVRDVLARLDRDGWLLGVATGKSLPGLRRCLTLHGLEERFVTLQTPDTAPGKPHPGMVLQAMEALGVRPVDTVVVGDTTYDMEMARNAGARAVGVAWGGHPHAALLAAGAETIVSDTAALLAALQGPRPA